MNTEEGKKVAIVATLATMFLSLLKGVVGLLSGSVSLVADAFHSLSDVFIIFATWVGLKISERKPNEKFPYGYYKAETMVSLLVSVFIVAAGIGIIRESIFFTPEKIKLGYVAILVALISSVASYVISVYEIRVGKKINSNALVMNGYESRLDIFTSLLVLVGVASSSFGIRYVESIVGVFISLLLIWYGLRGIYESVLILMDASPDSSVEKKIRNIINGTKGVLGIKSLKLRKAGVVFFCEVEIVVEGSLNVERAHEISDNIESKIKKEIPSVERITIHIEPRELERFVVAIPTDKFGKEVSDKFSRSQFFTLVEINKDVPVSFKVIENPFFDREIRAGLHVGKFISGKANVVIVKEIGEISFHTLRDNFVKIYKTNSDSVEDTLKKFLGGELEELHKETREVK